MVWWMVGDVGYDGIIVILNSDVENLKLLYVVHNAN
jgi:hypothetical protein